MTNSVFTTFYICFILTILCVIQISESVQNPNTLRIKRADLDDADEGSPELFSISMSAAKATQSDCKAKEGMAFHHRSHKCYKVLTRGPCGELQLFYRNKATPQLGRCTCVFNDEGCNTRVLGKDSGVRDINRPVIMSPDRMRCYYAFSQGPCPTGQWYVIDSKKRTPVCQPNPCTSPIGPVIQDEKVEATIKRKDVNVFWFFFNGKCHQTFTQAYCGDNEFVRFWGTDPRPTCFLTSNPRRSCMARTGAATVFKKCGVNNEGSQCKPDGASPIIFTVATPNVLKCDSGFRLDGDKCIPYGIFETGFEGAEIFLTGGEAGKQAQPGVSSEGLKGRKDDFFSGIGADPPVEATKNSVYVDLGQKQ